MPSGYCICCWTALGAGAGKSVPVRRTGSGGEGRCVGGLLCHAAMGLTLRCAVLCCVVLQEEGITELLLAPGKLADRIPGISGTRNLSDNLSDLKAQVGQLHREQGRGGHAVQQAVRDAEGPAVCVVSRRKWAAREAECVPDPKAQSGQQQRA